MVNKSKNIGTAGESAVVKVLRPYFPHAERLILAGAQDQGDIGHCGQFIFEVKAGKTAEQAGDGLLAKWTNETLAEVYNRNRVDSRVDTGILVLKRAGVGAANAHRWWAYISIADLAQLTRGEYIPAHTVMTRLELGQLLDMLADLGHAEDPEDVLAS